MKKSLSFFILSLIAFTSVFSLFSKPVFADGMMVKYDPYSDRWDYSSESNQQAYINYENGIQKMIISVGPDEKNSDGIVWLFPIPADPSKISIDITKNLPTLNGEEISKKIKSNLDTTKNLLFATQVYTIPYAIKSGFQPEKSMGNGVYALSSSSGFGDNIEHDVTVYGYLDKEGISSEIITAKTADGLYNYLKNKGLKIENGAIPVLDNYIGKNYSFIVSWLDKKKIGISMKNITEILFQIKRWEARDSYPKTYDYIDSLHLKYPNFHPTSFKDSETEQGQTIMQEMLQTIQNDPILNAEVNKKLLEIIEDKKLYANYSNQKGVLVSFPTKDIYFPLLPTSVYGDKIVPATIRIIGYVSPKIFQDIKIFSKTEYYNDSQINFSDDLKNFYSGPNKNIKYTKIEINAPSKFFTNDLWINNTAPAKTYYTYFIATHPILLDFLFLIISSIITGILVGWIIFKELRKKIVKLGLIGLSNCLSIYGLIITTIIVSTKEKNEIIDQILTEIKQKGYFRKRKMSAILFVMAIPFLMVGILYLPYVCENIPRMIKEHDSVIMIIILILYLIPLTAILICIKLEEIRLEDEGLFRQLESANYSSFMFKPKDKMKYLFVPAFSVTFLIISWLLVRLVWLTV